MKIMGPAGRVAQVVELASMRPWLQTPIPPKKRKKKMCSSSTSLYEETKTLINIPKVSS
jgi:hypothetical protein